MGLDVPAIFITLKWMATPGQLITAVAQVTTLSEKTIFQHDRNLVVAGLRTKGGRGTSAAKVTVRDAANLLTAVMGSEQVKDSVETVRRYTNTIEYYSSKYEPYEHPYKAVPALRTLPRNHSFIDALAVLLTLAKDDVFDREIGAGETSCIIDVGWPDTFAGIDLHKKSKRVAWGVYQRDTGDVRQTLGALTRFFRSNSVVIRHIGALLGDRLKV